MPPPRTGAAHLVSVTGIAGIGKSRLAWEFYKYFDGIADDRLVAPRPLSRLRRGRGLLGAGRHGAHALPDRRGGRDLFRPAEAEGHTARATARPRGALFRRTSPRPPARPGGAARAATTQDLFAAWRLFFERLADSNPTVLAFEDMQWADTSLLDFVEYLLEWSRDYPLYVITLARPELADRRPTWGAGQRNFSSLYLEPLSEESMQRAPGGARARPARAICAHRSSARAEGVPLYAVETVRMLLDRGLLTQDGPVYRPAGEIETLEVPETLHALIAARLDGVSAEERRLLQDGAVLGKTFTARALAALSGPPTRSSSRCSPR